MERISPRSFWIAVGVIAVFLLGIWEPDAGRGVVRTLVRLIFFAIAAGFAYQAYDGFRSALTGGHLEKPGRIDGDLIHSAH